MYKQSPYVVIIIPSFKRDIQNSNIDLDADTIRVMLVPSAFTPD
jgi:hypothetical protein